MEKRPEVDGSYVEIDASEIISKEHEAYAAKILVIKNARFEFTKTDREWFMSKFVALEEGLAEEMDGMDDGQKSFYILRHMLLRP